MNLKVIRLFLFQFVPFRDFLKGGHAANVQLSQAALAKEVLAEIPDQVLMYMKKFNITPKTQPPNVPGPAPVS